MNAEPARKRVWTPAEYLAWERVQPTKHAYVNGEIFDMAGASFEHNLVLANVIGALREALRDRPCRVCPSDLRVHVPASGLYTYPDAIVLCGPGECADGQRDTLLNPQVIIEVLSESTEGYDRGEKFEQYRTIPSFQEYLLARQDRPLVEHFVRQADGSWNLRERRAGDVIELSSLGCAIRVEEVYLKVFDAR